MAALLPWKALEAARRFKGEEDVAGLIHTTKTVLAMAAAMSDEKKRAIDPIGFRDFGCGLERLAEKVIALWPGINYLAANAIICCIQQDWKWSYDDIDDILVVKRPDDKNWATVRVKSVEEFRDVSDRVIKDAIVLSLVYTSSF